MGVSFFRGGARPPTQDVVAFIDANRADFGVEPIITVLNPADVTIAPSGYYAVKSRPPSPRQLRDKEQTVVLTGLWEANYRVYGARKLWRAARRAGHQVGRDQVGRLMKVAGLRGVRRGRQVLTTRPDRSAERHPDLVKRDFTATGPTTAWPRFVMDSLAGQGDACRIASTTAAPR